MYIFNVATFFTFGIDKLKAKHAKWAVIGIGHSGGSIAAWLGMQFLISAAQTHKEGRAAWLGNTSTQLQSSGKIIFQQHQKTINCYSQTIFVGILSDVRRSFSESSRTVAWSVCPCGQAFWTGILWEHHVIRPS